MWVVQGKWGRSRDLKSLGWGMSQTATSKKFVNHVNVVFNLKTFGKSVLNSSVYTTLFSLGGHRLIKIKTNKILFLLFR